ncbi:uncharacterized protein [Procambarus clarkii]|uniref:uncharacterized protein n=1 Tax=Procambarus clarkii TaxID=6728 RepID=UPI003742E57D
MDTATKMKRTLVGLKGHLTRQINKCQNLSQQSTVDYFELEDLLQVAESKFVHIKQHMNLYLTELQSTSIESSELDEVIDELAQYEEDIRVKLLPYKKQIAKNKLTVTSTVRTDPEVKLPQINIPTFSGDENESWDDFWSKFVDAVDSKTNIPPTPKFTYLQGLLRKEALKVISNITLTSDGYASAVQLLQTNYDNKERTVTVLVQKLLDLPSANNSTESLQNFRLELESLLKALSLKVQIQSAEWMTKVVVKRKLPRETLDKLCTIYNTTFLTLKEITEGLHTLVERQRANQDGEKVTNSSTNSYRSSTQVDTSIRPKQTLNKSNKFTTKTTLSTGKRSGNDNKPEECSVCFNDYDDTQLRPRTLPCGHAFCSQCIDNAIKNGQVTCPSCRAQHAATAATHFPISYGMEALIRKLKGIEVVPGETVPAKLIKTPARGIGKKLRSMVEEQKSIISSLITSCEEVLSQLGEYRGQLGDWKTHHLQLQDKLYALVEQNKSAMKLLELEDTSVVDMTTHGEEGKTQLQAMLGSLDTVNTPQEVDTTIDTADECSMKIEDWMEKCQTLFPNVRTVHTSVKVQETIREALEMTTTETGATADPVHLGDSSSSIMNKVQEITGEIPRKELTIEDLRRMSEPVKRLVEAGRVVAVKRLVEAGRVLAVQEDQDGRRSARITLQDGQLYLHPLLRQPTPTHAHTLQESEVVGVLEPSCTLAFLDLGWAGSTRGRVTIRLTPDTPLARQFVLLCTGQQGHTYHNTKLMEVWGKGQPGEWVAGGDYESIDGEGGAPLLPDLQGQYRESRQAGVLLASGGPGGPRSAQFIITTRDRQDGVQWSGVFGDVVSGLDVLRAAVNHSDITEVTVVDCGVVLPL